MINEERKSIELNKGDVNVIINGMNLILSMNKKGNIDLSKNAKNFYKEIKDMFETFKNKNFEE